MHVGKMGFSGSVTMRKFKTISPAPLSWKIKNLFAGRNWQGFLAAEAARLFSKVTGMPVMVGELSVRLIRANGTVVDYGKVSSKLVTDAFVAFMVDQLQTETSVWGDFKYHDSGVGTTAASNDDTDIETTDGESRATGDQGEGASAWIYQSVGTISYSTTKAITEHALFNDASAGTMMDHHVFSAINVVNGDSIEFTYQLSCQAET